MTGGGRKARPPVPRAAITPDRWLAAVLHVDMDAFYVAVEVRRDPTLRGRPVVVGGDGRRGVVAAASYEARAYGVRSAMPSVRARRLCPDALFLPGDHALYAHASAAIMAIFAEVTPLVEPLSLDEAFLDVTGAQRRLGSPPDIARQIRQRVAEEQQLSCSVGVASTKFLAKVASEAAKPTPSVQGPRPGPGVWVVTPGEELTFLHPLPVNALWGVGPATLAKLQRIGVGTVGDLASLPVATLVGALGEAAGRHLHDLAHNRDPRTVQPDREVKSMGHEETFPFDRFDRDDLEREVLRLADGVSRRLRAAGVAGRTVQLKVRFGDFSTITRSRRLPEPVDAGLELARAARELLAKVDLTPGIRLLGVSVSGLAAAQLRQLRLDLAEAVGSSARSGGGAPDPVGSAPLPAQGPEHCAAQSDTAARDAAWLDAHDTVDAIRRRFGAAAIGPASLASAGRLEVFERGQQAWGPKIFPETGPPAVPERPPSR